jgi:hypothetical protein
MGHVKIVRWTSRSFGDYEVRGFALPGVVSLPDYMFKSSDNFNRYNIIHEFGHIWDYRSGLTLSKEMSTFLGTRVCQTTNNVTICYFEIDAGREDAPGDYSTRDVNRDTLYAASNALEDWAEAFANVIYPDYYPSIGYKPIGPLRKQFVEDKINGIQ